MANTMSNANTASNIERIAEPIDRAACVATIKGMPDVEFSRYVYSTDACYGRTSEGGEILVYQTIQRAD